MGGEGWSEESLFKARLAAVLLEYHDCGMPLANLPKKYVARLTTWVLSDRSKLGTCLD